MDSHPVILIVSDDGDAANCLVEEITALFDSPRIEITETRSAVQGLKAGRFDICIVHSEQGDPGLVESVSQLRKAAPDLTILVSLPEDSDIPTDRLESFGRVYCFTRNTRSPIAVTTIIEEIVRQPSSVRSGWVGKTKAAGGGQTEIIRTAAGVLSHEINNPLMTILGVSELLLNEIGNKKNRELAQKVTMIRKSAERIESSLKRLLNIAETQFQSTQSDRIAEVETISDTRKSGNSRSIR